jgi:hypothetical protein
VKKRHQTGVEVDTPAPRTDIPGRSALGDEAQAAAPRLITTSVSVSGAGRGSSADVIPSPLPSPAGVAPHGDPPQGGESHDGSADGSSTELSGSSAASDPASPDAAAFFGFRMRSSPSPGYSLQCRIVKPKTYTDGTVRWGLMSTVHLGEPTTVEEALGDQ